MVRSAWGLLAALTVLVAQGAGGGRAQPSAGDIMIAIPGVPGPYCVYGIEKRLRELPGIERVGLLWEDERIGVVLAAGSRLTEDDVREAVRHGRRARVGVGRLRAPDWRRTNAQRSVRRRFPDGPRHPAG